MLNLISPKYQANLAEVVSIVDGFGFDANDIDVSKDKPKSYDDFENVYLKELLEYKKDDFTLSPTDSPEL